MYPIGNTCALMEIYIPLPCLAHDLIPLNIWTGGNCQTFGFQSSSESCSLFVRSCLLLTAHLTRSHFCAVAQQPKKRNQNIQNLSQRWRLRSPTPQYCQPPNRSPWIWYRWRRWWLLCGRWWTATAGYLKPPPCGSWRLGGRAGPHPPTAHHYTTHPHRPAIQLPP